MNWLEFKEAIEEQLHQQGIPLEAEVDYIELGYITKDNIEVGQDKRGDITITEA